MSFIHFQLVPVGENNGNSTYLVNSSSFHPRGEVEIGKVIIDKITKRYEFIPSEEWKSSGFSLPHSFYQFEKDEDLEALAENDRPKGWPWGLLIHKRILSLIRREYSKPEE